MAFAAFTWLRQWASQAGCTGVWSLTVSISFLRRAAKSSRTAAIALRRPSAEPFLALLERGAQAFAQHGERGPRVARDQEIGLHLAERIAAGQRIAGDLDDLGVAPRQMGARNPRHDALEHDHHVGLGEQGGGLEAHMHGMVDRQVEVARLALHHRQRELFAPAPRAHRWRPDRGRCRR